MNRSKHQVVFRVPKGTNISSARGCGEEGKGGGGGEGEEKQTRTVSRGDRFRVPLRCLLGVRVRGVRICQFAAASAAGSVSSGSVRASVTRDLQHGGAQEKQEAQRCKRRIWTAIVTGPVWDVGTRCTANARRDRSTRGATRVAACDRSRSVDPWNASVPISDRSEWRRQTLETSFRSGKIANHQLAVSPLCR